MSSPPTQRGRSAHNTMGLFALVFAVIAALAGLVVGIFITFAADMSRAGSKK